MMTMDRKLGALSASALAVLLAGCSSGSDGPNTGTLSLAVSDGPVHDAEEVCLEFDEIEIKKAGSPPEMITGDEMTLQQVNLLKFQGPNSAPLFMDIEVEAGEYEWIRLGVNASLDGGGFDPANGATSDGCTYAGSYVLFEGEMPYKAFVPSGAQTGLKINSTFVVAAGGATSMTADFNLQKTLTEPPGLDGTIVIRPSIRLMNDLDVGSVFGTVDASLAAPEDGNGNPLDCDPSVFAFFDDPAVDISVNELDEADSIASDLVEAVPDSNPVVYSYEIGYLEIGNSYDLAFSCDDGTTFEGGIGTVTIENAGDAEELNFPVPQPAE